MDSCLRAAGRRIHPLPFRIGRRDLLIPWDAMHDRPPFKPVRHRVMRVQVGLPAIARMQLPAAVFDADPKVLRDHAHRSARDRIADGLSVWCRLAIEATEGMPCSSC